MNEIEQDKRYVLKISTDAGNVIVMPSSDNKIIVKSTVDKQLSKRIKYE